MSLRIDQATGRAIVSDWFRPVSHVVIATRGPDRYFDLDGVRTDLKNPGCEGASRANGEKYRTMPGNGISGGLERGRASFEVNRSNPAGAPPLDWHIDEPHQGEDVSEALSLFPIDPDVHVSETPGGPKRTEAGRWGHATVLVGDVRDRLADIPDSSVDFLVTSPPFLALRSYLPADHPDKHREIGSEPDPATFIDTLLALTADWGRVLAPWGSIAVELGDTFAGSGDNSQDWTDPSSPRYRGNFVGQRITKGTHWPLAKSLCGIPQAYALSLMYGRNVLNGNESPAGRWRVRNIIVWARPNPPVGSLGKRNVEKRTGDQRFRVATSYITVACRDTGRYFDLDGVRLEGSANTHARLAKGVDWRPNDTKVPPNGSNRDTLHIIDGPAGAPPLDWHADHHPADGDWLWKLPTAPYKGSHYATFPITLPRRLIEAMCPRSVCTALYCGRCGHVNGSVNTGNLEAVALGGEAVPVAEAVQEELRHLRRLVRGEEPVHVQSPMPGDTHQAQPSVEGPDAEHGGAGTDSPRGVHPDLGAGSPESGEGLRPGTPPRDGEAPGSLPREVGVCAPSQRGEARQSPGELGAGDGASAQRRSALSALRRVFLDSLICPKCGGVGATVCGWPRERVVEVVDVPATKDQQVSWKRKADGSAVDWASGTIKRQDTIGWTDCGHNAYRPGIVLDPFLGSGTTAAAALHLGRDAIGIELDTRNLDLIRQRIRETCEFGTVEVRE